MRGNWYSVHITQFPNHDPCSATHISFGQILSETISPSIPHPPKYVSLFKKVHLHTSIHSLWSLAISLNWERRVMRLLLQTSRNFTVLTEDLFSCFEPHLYFLFCSFPFMQYIKAISMAKWWFLFKTQNSQMHKFKMIIYIKEHCARIRRNKLRENLQDDYLYKATLCKVNKEQVLSVIRFGASEVCTKWLHFTWIKMEPAYSCLKS